MIDEIQVHNLALIRDATFTPCEGLTVITGETGAGKTALLSALKLLMGVRASADMVRDGEEELFVAGRFFLDETHERIEPADTTESIEPSEAAKPAEPTELPEPLESAKTLEPTEPIELVVTRKVGADGRSRTSVDGSMASVKELASLIAPAVDLCGQFEHQQLMKPTNHLHMLDAWAGERYKKELEEYRQAFAEATAAAAELARVQEAGKLSSAQLDEARFTLKRIDEVNPAEGEYEQLLHDLQIAEHAESLAIATGTAHEALSGESGTLDALNTAAAALESVGRVDKELALLAQSLREAGYVLEDVSAQTRDYRDGIEFDAETLAYQQERYSNMQGLLRAYGPRMEDVFAAREKAAQTVALVDDSEALLKAAQRAVDNTEQALAHAADALDDAREKAAPDFSAAVSAVMNKLEMGGAELVCNFQRRDRNAWTALSPSSFEFMYRPGASLQARPLTRIASGGEVSRVMLATKVVLGSVDYVDTLVFDEVDAGVGGAVAVALADVLADLARTHQVIVVTHLAQVAVRGQSHYVVRREQSDAGPETLLSPVTGQARIDEIARMLSGSTTETSRAHARELLGV